MTTRRKFLALTGGALTATWLGGCRPRGRPAATAGSGIPDVLFVDSPRGLARLTGAGTRNLGASAVLSCDGGFLYAVNPDAAGEPSLVRLDPLTGTSIRSTPLGGGWLPRVISTDGRACALGRSAATERPAARARTSLLVTTGDDQRRYELAGVVEPDAFTGDRSGLFVLEWLPARAPEKYRVRLLDLATGTLHPLYTRDKVPVPPGAEEEMRGTGREAVLSADRQMLYTLYTHQPGHQHTRDLIAGTRGDVHAFVHCLNLAAGWAYCLDLPHPFGEGPAAAHALAVDGERLAVADVSSGSLAFADPAALTVSRVVSVPAVAGPASVVLAPDRRVLVGAGDGVTVLGPGSAAVTARWPVPGTVRGLGLSRDGSRLYAGGSGEVVRLDAGSGKLRGRFPVGGMTALRHVA